MIYLTKFHWMCDILIGCLVLVGRSANHMHFSSALHFVLLILYSKTQSKRSSEASLTFALARASPALRNVLKGAGLGCAGLTWASSIWLQVRKLLVKICMPIVGCQKKRKKTLWQVNLGQQPDAHWATFTPFPYRTWEENRMKKLEEFKIRTIIWRDALK